MGCRIFGASQTDGTRPSDAAALVYQLDYSTGAVNVSSIDITSSTGLADS
jgi:hypothetical protein